MAPVEGNDLNFTSGANSWLTVERSEMAGGESQKPAALRRQLALLLLGLRHGVKKQWSERARWEKNLGCVHRVSKAGRKPGNGQVVACDCQTLIHSVSLQKKPHLLDDTELESY